MVRCSLKLRRRGAPNAARCMENIMEWLEEPLKVWHLLVVVIVFGISFAKTQKQLNAIGKCAYEVWEKLCSSAADD